MTILDRMGRGCLTILFFPVLVYGSSAKPWASYHAPKRTFPIVIDGDISEWEAVPSFVMNQSKFFFVGQDMSSAKWRGPDDLSATFKITWDERYIYLAVQVRDDRVTEPHGSLVRGNETGSWDDDGVELMFDNDACGMSRYYIGDPLHHEFHFVFSTTRPFVFDNFWLPKLGAPQAMFIHADGTLEPLAYPDEVMVKHDVTDIFSKPPYNGRYAFKRTRNGYNLEVRMSLPGARTRPFKKDGRMIGFDVAINDNDLGKGPLKQQLHWSGVNGMFWRDTADFGRLIFY
jgi:hypothetical protein